MIILYSPELNSGIVESFCQYFLKLGTLSLSSSSVSKLTGMPPPISIHFIFYFPNFLFISRANSTTVLIPVYIKSNGIV